MNNFKVVVSDFVLISTLNILSNVSVLLILKTPAPIIIEAQNNANIIIDALTSLSYRSEILKLFLILMAFIFTYKSFFLEFAPARLPVKPKTNATGISRYILTDNDALLKHKRSINVKINSMIDVVVAIITLDFL